MKTRRGVPAAAGWAVGRTAEEVGIAVAEGAEGVGLLRTELLFVDRDRPPALEEQVAVLRDVRGRLGDRPLVVRTFDIGSDKQVPFLPARPERNPELGLRGLRLAARHPDLLETQLRAVAEVAELGPTAVMAPMVATVDEVEWFVKVVEKLAGHGRLGVGVMVEVPAAVLLAREFAERVDFLSIGTNDLTQYLMAADRRHAELAAFHDPFHPAVVRAVAMVCEGAAGRCPVAVCGEAASVPGWALLAVGLGVRELSMQGTAIAEVRAAIRNVTHAACRAAAEEAIRGRDGLDVASAAAGILAQAGNGKG